MKAVCKLQIISLLVLVSFLSIGISVLLLLASGSWQRQEELHNDIKYQEHTHISNSYRQPQLSVVNLLEDSSTDVKEQIRHKRYSKKRLQTTRIIHPYDSNKSIITEDNTKSWKIIPGVNDEHSITTNSLCPDPASLCLDFLPLEQLTVYKECAAKTMATLNGLYHCNCQFMNTTESRHVALVSLPGSGNTWLRGLIERASGVCTGSLFCDKTLHGGGMCGEGLHDGVLVIKTHDTKLQWTNVHYKEGKWSDKRPFFDAAILLIRSPFKALIAEWNRQNAYKFSSSQLGSSHVKYLQSSEYFLDNKKWNDFVMEELRKWKMIISENVIRNKDHQIIVVFYENLQSNQSILVRKVSLTMYEDECTVDGVHVMVERVLNFLHFPYTTEQMTLAVERGFSSYYRNHTDNFNHFTEQQRNAVNDAIVETVNRLRTHNFTDIANHIDTYQSYDG